MNDRIQNLVKDLPDPEAARRFIEGFEKSNPSQFTKLAKNDGLLSDVLALTSYSPMIATTLLQNPDHVVWLARARTETQIATKEDLLEALGRFSLTHSDLGSHVLLARFRRRELIRTFLRDIRRLATTAEVTEEISNLADAVLEYAFQQAKRELDNLYGIPLESDERGRSKPAEFCIVSLGKLGSKELNYASDIDLLFIYSADGSTSGQGERGVITNLEYFTKLCQKIIKTVGAQLAEGAAYRVDLRLRPHGSLGPLAQSLKNTTRYYRNEARRWEMQVLIRSRSCAGEQRLFERFFEEVEDHIFAADVALGETLANVRESKDRIDRKNVEARGFNVKLGAGGIRELEFVAQGLQLAYGANDKWLRTSHTLITLSRLADRHLISENEFTQASGAYDFLRHVEHILQMENGLQTHTVLNEPNSRALVSAKMGCASIADFDEILNSHTQNVHGIFERVFGQSVPSYLSVRTDDPATDATSLSPGMDNELSHLNVISPRYAALTVANPVLKKVYLSPPRDLESVDYRQELSAVVDRNSDFRQELSSVRSRWSELFHEIVFRELDGDIDVSTSKTAQTKLAEASLETAIIIANRELRRRCVTEFDQSPFAVLALGKLGGGAIDYESDLDVLFVFEDESTHPEMSASEYYSKAAEIIVTVLSGVTKDGNLYRVDLRLRPYGKNGTLAISVDAFMDYLRDKAEVWELLAFVKIRGVAGNLDLALSTENSIRKLIHARSKSISTQELREETLRIRDLLEVQRAGRRNDMDIKYGAGGMLDVYFALRFLQLSHDIPDRENRRSTQSVLSMVRDQGAISEAHFDALSSGYEFLSLLDHYFRLIVGRTTRVPVANSSALDLVAGKLGLGGHVALIEQLTFHRLNIRAAYNEIMGRDA